MALGVETIGNYDIKKLPNGMYSVSLNNGNMGAFMTDEAGLLKFKEKYANKGDTFASNNTKKSNKPKMSYEEANKIILLSTVPGALFLLAATGQYTEALEAIAYYRTHGVK
jgi:hypothetical protein